MQTLTPAQVATLQGRNLEIDFGADLLDDQDEFVADVKADVVGGEVDHDNYAAIHGSCKVDVLREFDWGKARLRLWQSVNGDRFNLGTFILTTPERRVGEDPQVHSVTGYDKLYLLGHPVGDTYTVGGASGGNLVANGSFESNTTGWESNPAYDAYTPASFARSTTRATDGAASLLVTWPTSTAVSNSWVNTTHPAVVGTRYKITADVWVPAGSPGVRAAVAFLGSGEGTATASKGQWTRVSHTFTATGTTHYVGIEAVDPTTAGQQVWVDNFRVEPLAVTYLDAIRQVLTDAGGTGLAPRFAGDAEGKVIDAPMVWMLDSDRPATWLDVVNDLLAAIGYRGLWCDQDGRYRSEPYQAPSVRPPEWTFDLSDPRTNMVGEDRTFKVDGFTETNWWRFIRDGLDHQPTEGDGLYTVDRTGGGPRVPATVKVTVADQDALIAEGDRRVDEDTRQVRTLEVTTGPLPALGHMDVTHYQDPLLGVFRCLSKSHTIPLDGGDVSLTLEVVD